jgi:hypothetical protein
MEVLNIQASICFQKSLLVFHNGSHSRTPAYIHES